MIQNLHHYNTSIFWTGNIGTGTNAYNTYERSHILQITGKKDLECSSDPAFNGDAGKHNPEELLLASVSSCHMLWYLHLCSVAGIVVLSYEDKATGIMQEDADGSGRFVSIHLSPNILIADKTKVEQAVGLHHSANKKCFIANSLNFPVTHSAAIKITH